MKIKNTETGYGLIARFFHWFMALGIIGLFGLGYWMTGLGYYDSWYQTGPYIHKGFGMIMVVLLVLRYGWRLMNTKPDDSDIKPMERKAAHATHMAFYGLMAVIMISGYLISTVDGRGIDVFGVVTVPAVYEKKGLEELAGDVHEILAYILMGLVAVHMAAALKHHFIDRDDTLKKMTSDPR